MTVGSREGIVYYGRCCVKKPTFISVLGGVAAGAQRLDPRALVVLNIVNYGQPGTAVPSGATSTTFGVIRTAGAMRRLQLGLRLTC